MKTYILAVTAALTVSRMGWIPFEVARMGDRGAPCAPRSALAMRTGPPLEMIAWRLGLSDDQKDQWRAIYEIRAEGGAELVSVEEVTPHVY